MEVKAANFKKAYQILVVDDDTLILASTCFLLNGSGFNTGTAQNGTQALEYLERHEGKVALVILDYQLKEETGAQIAQKIKAKFPNQYMLMHSGNESTETVKNSWNAGAIGYLLKSEPPDALIALVKNWCIKFEQTHLTVSYESSLDENSLKISSIGMIGRSQVMADISDRIHRYAKNKENVLILGETGTGKEKISRALHLGKAERYFAVNCAVYNAGSELMEADLFGYVRGAFTGANKDHKGIFEVADGGTVFLDEVHTLSLTAQQKLLRAIQEKVVRPVGSVREYSVNFRLIAAAKPEIETAVNEGRFLPDLYERLNVLRIDIPPLRSRLEDIEPLVAYFCETYEKETQKKKSVLRRTLSYLESYSWPRNVRELENTIRRLCVDVQDTRIEPEHLEAKFFSSGENTYSENFTAKKRWDLNSKKDIEQALIVSRSQREAARKLGIPESSLRNLIKKHQISTKPVSLQEREV